MCDFGSGTRAGDEGGEEGLTEFIVLNRCAIGGVADKEEGLLICSNLFTNGMSDGGSAGKRYEVIVR